MSFEQKRRREILGKAGKGLLSVLGGWIALGASTRRAEAGVFAGTLLKDKTPTRIPEGYYDERLQVYVDASTRKPMFVRESAEPLRCLTDAELEALGIELDPVKLADRQLIVQLGPGESCTLSRDTSYSTTTCCPIVTDTKQDTGCDDTPGK
jgi:hypothetical protein